jgi:hypothetical protein
MTEGFSGDISPNQNAQTTESIATASAPVAQSSPQEKFLPQSKVNELIGHAKKEAEERVRREFEQQQVQRNAQPSASSMGGIAQLTDDQIAQKMAQVAQSEVQKLVQQHAQKLQQESWDKEVRQFADKIIAGAQEFPDFDAKVSELDISAYPELIPILNAVDNTAAVLYDLASNPLKAEGLRSLAIRNRKGALNQMRVLAESIKANKSALEQKQPSEPLSQINQSLTPMDNGSQSISALRKADWLRA